MELNIECKFGGVQVKNITGYLWSVARPVAPNGTVGSRAHEIGTIRISRRKSLHDGGSPKLEGEIVDFAAATEQKAYMEGTITLARPDDSANPVQTLRWKKGHICGLTTGVSGGEIDETIELAVTELQVDNATFKRTATT